MVLNSTGSIPAEELAKWLPLDKTFGAFLLGTFLGLMYVLHLRINTHSPSESDVVWFSLYGLIINQACRYYRHFQSDDSFIRLLVRMPILAPRTFSIQMDAHRLLSCSPLRPSIPP